MTSTLILDPVEVTFIVYLRFMISVPSLTNCLPELQICFQKGMVLPNNGTLNLLVALYIVFDKDTIIVPTLKLHTASWSAKNHF